MSLVAAAGTKPGLRLSPMTTTHVVHAEALIGISNHASILRARQTCGAGAAFAAGLLLGQIGASAAVEIRRTFEALAERSPTGLWQFREPDLQDRMLHLSDVYPQDTVVGWYVIGVDEAMVMPCAACLARLQRMILLPDGACMAALFVHAWPASLLEAEAGAAAEPLAAVGSGLTGSGLDGVSFYRISCAGQSYSLQRASYRMAVSAVEAVVLDSLQNDTYFPASSDAAAVRQAVRARISDAWHRVHSHMQQFHQILGSDGAPQLAEARPDLLGELRGVLSSLQQLLGPDLPAEDVLVDAGRAAAASLVELTGSLLSGAKLAWATCLQSQSQSGSSSSSSNNNNNNNNNPSRKVDGSSKDDLSSQSKSSIASSSNERHRRRVRPRHSYRTSFPPSSVASQQEGPTSTSATAVEDESSESSDDADVED